MQKKSDPFMDCPECRQKLGRIGWRNDPTILQSWDDVEAYYALLLEPVNHNHHGPVYRGKDAAKLNIVYPDEVPPNQSAERLSKFADETKKPDRPKRRIEGKWFVTHLSQGHAVEVSDMADRIYPSELYEPMAVFSSRIAFYPDGCLGLYAAGELAGYCFFHPYSEHDELPLGYMLEAAPEPSKTVYIHDFAIDEKHRGKGYGEAFFTHVLGLLKSHGFERANGVAVLDSLPFWERMGFEGHGEVVYEGVAATKVRMKI